MKLENNDLLKITGGAISASLISAIVRGVSIIIDLGRGLGTTIRRISENKTCKLD